MTKTTKTHPVPNELKQWPQWVPWRYGRFRKDGSREKHPIDPSTGGKGGWNRPGMWRSLPDAEASAAEHGADGVGFVFAEDDPFCGLDFDECGDRATGYVHPAVLDILRQLGNPYAEWSPSGTGVKAWVRATKPGGRCKTVDTPWGGTFEMYDRNQFFTVTGDVIRDAPVRDAQAAVNALYGRFFPSVVSRVGTGLATASAGFPGDDGDLLEKARNHPKTGGLFRKLHDHDGASGYPSRSEADMAYCGMLAYWTGCDAERIKRLFRASPRSRGKYAERGQHAEGYLDRTVSRAISECRSAYDPSYGEGKKARVRETVTYHRDALAKSDLRGSKRAAMDYLLGVASKCGMDRGGEVEFNANQEEIAGAVGVGQRQVSNVVKDLLRTTPTGRGEAGRHAPDRAQPGRRRSATRRLGRAQRPRSGDLDLRPAGRRALRIGAGRCMSVPNHPRTVKRPGTLAGPFWRGSEPHRPRRGQVSLATLMLVRSSPNHERRKRSVNRPERSHR